MQPGDRLARVYPGHVVPPARDTVHGHREDAWYFAPPNWANPVPFSAPFASQGEAELAALEWESRQKGDWRC